MRRVTRLADVVKPKADISMSTYDFANASGATELSAL